MGGVFVVLLIQGLVFGFFCGYIAEQKNRSFGSWFALGFFFSILGVLALIAVPKIERPPSPDDKKPDKNKLRGERLVPSPEQASPTPHIPFSGLRDISVGAYQLFLTKRFDIEKNNTLDMFVIGTDVFDTLPAALADADARYTQQLAELAAETLRLEREARVREQARLDAAQHELALAKERQLLEEARRMEAAALARNSDAARKKALRRAMPWALGAIFVVIAAVGFLIRQRFMQAEEERLAWQATGKLVKDCAECPGMLLIPAGKFEMGSDSSESTDEKPQHQVKLSAFLLGQTEVTQGQWRAIMGTNPSHFKDCGDDCPVENVSWDDAQQFASKLSQKTGKHYRLPSEAEWEYAAQAGGRGRWGFGNDESQLGQYAWFTDNSGAKTHPVGQKKASVIGLHDMHGNVGEWVQDVQHADYQDAPSDGSAWVGGDPKALRIVRGGSWDYGWNVARSSYRDAYGVSATSSGLGFRIARTP